MTGSALSYRDLERTDVRLLEGDLPASTLRQFLQSAVVACDIETTGLDWTKDKIATCQVYSPSVGAFVVRITQGIPGNLASLLNSPDVLKIFHHAMFDLRFMQYQWSVEPKSIWCTKIAAKLLTPVAEDTTLQAVTRQLLGVHLDKSERLSNWLSHDLTPRQVEYAAADVIYLPALIDALRERLLESGQWEIALMCFDFLPTRVSLDLLGVGDVFAYQSLVAPQTRIDPPRPEDRNKKIPLWWRLLSRT